jgi:hypothetical protein
LGCVKFLSIIHRAPAIRVLYSLFELGTNCGPFVFIGVGMI